MILLESQRLSWDLITRVAVGDRDGAARAWHAAGHKQRRQAGVALVSMTDLVRELAVMQAGAAAPFRTEDIPGSLCAEGRRFADAFHRGRGEFAMSTEGWPGCDCQFDLAEALAGLYLRQGEEAGYSRGEQASVIARMLAAMDQSQDHLFRRDIPGGFAYDGPGNPAHQEPPPVPLP